MTQLNAAASDDARKARLRVWLAVALMLIAALSFAGSIVAGRAASGNVPPMAMSFIRWAIAFALFACLGGRALWRARAVFIRNFPMMCVFALFGVVGFTVPYYVGLQFTKAANATLLNASGPIMTLFISFAMLGLIPTRRQGIGIALAIAGTLVILARGNLELLNTLQFNIGDLYMLSAFFSWAMYTVMLRWRPRGLDEMAFLAALGGLATCMHLPMYLWEISQGVGFEATSGNLLLIGYAAVFPSFLGYICWNYAVRTLGPNTTSLTQYLIPAFGLILSVLILGEVVFAFHAVGIVLIFGGVYLSGSKRSKENS